MYSRQGRVVFVEHLSPVLEDVKDGVTVPVWVVVFLFARLLQPSLFFLNFRLSHERFRHVFRQGLSDVDPESGDTSVSPEPQGGEEVIPNFLVVPVEIGLRGVEHVEVELTVPDWLPDRATKEALPVVGWFGLVRSFTY